MTMSTPRRLAAAALLAAFAAGACTSTGAGGGSSEPSSAAPGTGGGISGSVLVAGSSTVEPISTGVAEAFKAANPEFQYTITGEGTGDAKYLSVLGIPF